MPSTHPAPTSVRHRGGALKARLALAASSTLLIACALAALSPAAMGATTKSCGPTPIQKPTGGYWTCTFGDDFSGTSLNAGNWQVMSTAMWGFTTAGECYVNDPSTITVANSALTLTANKLRSPAACGPMTSQYQSGMIFTKDRFAQTYGRFEARAKMPTGVGFQPAFWMWPQDMAYGNRSGEIDIVEAFGSHPDIASPHIHMLDALGVDHGDGAYCNVAYSDGRFHTYTLEWSPATMTFSYDGTTCWTISKWSPPAFLATPQPFDKPFFINLQLALGYGVNAVTDRSPFPTKFVVDYVRAWR